MIEYTLIILKPECLTNKHMWEVITRIEKTWLKIVAWKILKADRDTAWNHYPDTRSDRVKAMWQRSIDNYNEYWLDITSDFKWNDPHAIWLQVRERLINMLTESNIFVMVVEWEHAVEAVRKLVWHTVPLKAQSGTIRWDFSTDSAYTATTQKRPIKNMIHASWTIEEANYEIWLRFPEFN